MYTCNPRDGLVQSERAVSSPVTAVLKIDRGRERDGGGDNAVTLSYHRTVQLFETAIKLNWSLHIHIRINERWRSSDPAAWNFLYLIYLLWETETVYCCRDPSSHRLLLSQNQTMAAVCVFRCMQEQKSCDFEHTSSNRSQHALVSWKQSSAIIIYGGFHPSQSRTSFQVLLLFPQFANLDLVISRNSVAFVVVYMDSVLDFLECISFGECDLSMCSFKCYTW